MTELKSCPFCGGIAAHFELNEAVFKATWVSHVTHCTKCQARVQSLNSEASIILWNTRANPPTEPVAWRFRLKDDWKFSGDNPDTWPNKHLRENAEIEPLYATPTPEGGEVRQHIMEIVDTAAFDAAGVTNAHEIADTILRFFIEHGMIHDRVTGKHVTTEGTPPFEDGVEQTCELLNSLTRPTPEGDFVLVSREAMKEIGDIILQVIDGGNANLLQAARGKIGWLLMIAAAPNPPRGVEDSKP